MKGKNDMAKTAVEEYIEETFGICQCDSCKHYDEENGTCRAFKEQIPIDIIDGTHDHTKPYSGDNGIMHEKKDNKDE